ncbi:hypothetical protein F8388_000882 [Cannabis sativa]|uniref:Reverse transcriptase zinc-binding domain-containing protein n=1 Tax=Cannabis sativa TaxID=3483 RepID=A0A7J6FPY4_CANSA|nr:hypothetical protein F8388_000882 [Cannabis sativa]
MKIRSSTDEISILLAEKGGKFCAKLFYNLQVEAQEVKYSRAVWNKLIVPKHRFIFWQACNVQLLTRKRLLRLEAGWELWTGQRMLSTSSSVVPGQGAP